MKHIAVPHPRCSTQGTIFSVGVVLPALSHSRSDSGSSQIESSHEHVHVSRRSGKRQHGPNAGACASAASRVPATGGDPRWQHADLSERGAAPCAPLRNTPCALQQPTCIGRNGLRCPTRSISTLLQLLRLLEGDEKGSLRTTNRRSKNSVALEKAVFHLPNRRDAKDSLPHMCSSLAPALPRSTGDLAQLLRCAHPCQRHIPARGFEPENHDGGHSAFAPALTPLSGLQVSPALL